MGQQHKLQRFGGKTVWKATNCMEQKWNVVGMAVWEKSLRVGNGLRWFRIGTNAADTPGMFSRIIGILLIIND